MRASFSKMVPLPAQDRVIREPTLARRCSIPRVECKPGSFRADVSRRIRSMDLLPALHFVYLSRDDLLGQAISWTRALQVEQYRSTQRAKGDAIYDGDLI